MKKSILTAMVALGVFASACSNNDPLGDNQSEADNANGSDSAETIVVGSAQYYSNEIIAEIFAQAIEDRTDYSVDREFQIGSREVYLASMGEDIDIIPEYTGNLLQFWDKKTVLEDQKPDTVYEALKNATPEGLEVLDTAAATDQDSYVVTQDFATENNVTSLSDLAGLGRTLKVGANAELDSRPFGPEGLKSVYGVDSEHITIEDSGGPLTVKALNDGKVDFANIYTASPFIGQNDFVVLDDPENLFLPQQVVPLVVDTLPNEVKDTLNWVVSELTTEELIDMNTKSVEESLSSKEIAADWLESKSE